MIKCRLSVIGLFLVLQTNAQLLNEFGFFVGGSNYSGDVGNEIYIYPNKLAGGLAYKRYINTRLSLRATVSIYQLSDSDTNSKNVVRQRRGYEFSNTLYEVAVGLEFNYFDYDITFDAHSFTPYILFELAGFSYSTVTEATTTGYNYTNKIAYAIPLGIGFKSKIINNLSCAIELRARYTFKDDLDFNNNDISTLNFGNPKTNDWYFFTGISLFYSFGRPRCAVESKY